MMNIRPDQHGKILGFAILGYGLQFVFDLLFQLNRIRVNMVNPYSDLGLGEVLYMVFTDDYKVILFSLVSMLAGLSLLAVRARSKIPALVFALGAVSLFPLGTILSFYTLFFLFVIREQDDETSN